MSSTRPSERRRSVRTTVVWAALQRALERPGAEPGTGTHEGARIIDIGGGTGGFAVPLAEQGHRVQVVDPSPDALAALGRRAAEKGVTDRVTGQQGDLGDLGDLGDTVGEADLVLCHGVLEVVEDPAAALRTVAGVLSPHGTLSLLVAQRHAAVIARAMAGHFRTAQDLLDEGPGGDQGRGVHRYTVDELTGLLRDGGFEPSLVHGVRVFADLVPGSLLDLEPGASASLVELERSVAARPEFLPLATQLHVLSTR